MDPPHPAMFNIRYNALAMYQVALGLLNSLLLMKVFGVSGEADAYLIALSIATSLQYVQLMFVEQFLFFYHDLKIVDRQGAKEFYHTAVTFSLLSGVILFPLFVLAVHPLISLFAFGIDPERYLLLRKILNIMFLGVIVDSANVVNQRLLNAEMKFSIPYVLGSLQALLTALLLVYLIVTGQTGIELIAGARAAGACVACLAGFAVVGRMGFRFRLSLRHPSLIPFVKNSLAMRFGHNIQNFLVHPITNNILALLPSGFASIFYYAQRLHTVIGSVVVAPGYTVLQAKVSLQWAERNKAGIKSDIMRFLPSAAALFAIATTVVLFLIPVVLGLLGSRSMQPRDIRYIQSLFLALTPWSLVVLLESPFLSVSVASKKSIVFIATNSVFIVTYFSLSLLMAGQFGIYTIPAAMGIAQVLNLATFATFSWMLLKDNGQTVRV
jgi:hypothetical protein